MKIFKIYMGVFFMLLAMSAFANDFNSDEFSKTYNTVMQQDKNEMYKAIAILDKALQKDPMSPQILMYKGSILAKIADKDFFFWDKLAHVNKGIDLMAKAMDILDSKAGESVSEEDKERMYVIHGITSALIPAAFKQEPVAVMELKKAINHKYFNNVDAEYQAQCYGLLSKLYRKRGEKDKAEAMLQKGMRIDPKIAEMNAK